MSSQRLEVLLSSESSGQMFNMCVWDAMTGTNLRVYKGNATKSKTCTFLGNTFLVSGQPHKPLLNVWQINKHEQKPQKFITPGILHSITASPCGHFLVGTAEERIYVWQTNNGKLLRIISNGHYQKITCSKFLSDGSHFVTAGEDGNVILWPLDSAKPRHIWSHHSLPVTDFHVGIGGLNSRVFSVSKDQTCKIYEVSSGHFLLDVEFNSPLLSIAVDSAEETAFVGTSSGAILKFSLLSPPRDMKLAIQPGSENSFQGHSQGVTCLSVSIDGLTLASGSLDTDVRIWHVKSRQCIKVIPHKGALTTLMFMIPKRGMLDQDDFKPDIQISLLEKTIVDKNAALSDLYSLEVISSADEDRNVKEPSARSLISSARSQSFSSNGQESLEEGDDDEILKLKRINQKLYEAAVKAIMNE